MSSVALQIRGLSREFYAKHDEYAELLFDVLVVAEDRRARWHIGVDFISIIRAAIVSFETGSFRGISTIEQQLIRTLRPRRYSALVSKPLEFSLATMIALRFPKRIIWSAYLSCAYFGSDWDTFDEVVDSITSKSGAMTLDEACALVAYLKYPQSDDWPEGERLHRRRTAHLVRLCSGRPRLASVTSAQQRS